MSFLKPLPLNTCHFSILSDKMGNMHRAYLLHSVVQWSSQQHLCEWAAGWPNPFFHRTPVLFKRMTNYGYLSVDTSQASSWKLIKPICYFDENNWQYCKWCIQHFQTVISIWKDIYYLNHYLRTFLMKVVMIPHIV